MHVFFLPFHAVAPPYIFHWGGWDGSQNVRNGGLYIYLYSIVFELLWNLYIINWFIFM